MKKLVPFLVICLSIFLGACSEPSWRERLLVDTSGIKVKLDYHRLDKTLFESSDWSINQLNENYAPYFEQYCQRIVGVGNPKDSLTNERLKAMTSDSIVKLLYKEVLKEYPKVNSEISQLTSAFKHLKYYYPKAEIPTIIFSPNLFNYGCVATEKQIGIGLEMYPHEKGNILKYSPKFPKHIKNKMKSKYLSRDAISIWLQTHYLDKHKRDLFLDNLIFHGKIMYALDALFPKKPDHIKIKYSVDEMAWCLKHEEKIWLTLVDRDMLKTVNPVEIKKFFEPAPFTAGLSQENSPDRVGIFVGWMIVRDYMIKNKELTLPDLFKEDNSQKILNAYKPGENE